MTFEFFSDDKWWLVEEATITHVEGTRYKVTFLCDKFTLGKNNRFKQGRFRINGEETTSGGAYQVTGAGVGPFRVHLDLNV